MENNKKHSIFKVFIFAFKTLRIMKKKQKKNENLIRRYKNGWFDSCVGRW